MKLPVFSSLGLVLGKLGRRGGHAAAGAPGLAAGILRRPRVVALVLAAFLVTTASLVSFAESYRGLYLWADHHGLTGLWAALWPLQIDSFIAVGELSLFVGLVDGWRTRSRAAGWLVILAGLAVSVGGNIGHVAGHSLTVRGTAAVPPLAAASALAVGLGVLKRVVKQRTSAAGPHTEDDDRETVAGTVPSTSVEAAKASMRATVAAGNPWSINQLAERFLLTRATATRLHREVLAESAPAEAEAA